MMFSLRRVRWPRGLPYVCRRSWESVEALQLVGGRVWRTGGRLALRRVLDEVLLRPERDLLERGQ